jgi:PAS domain S-box-containing protein
VSITISYFIAKPIEKLTENIDKISKGKLDVDLEQSEIKEINNLVDSLNRVMVSLKLAVYKVGIKKGEIFENVIKINENKKDLNGNGEKKQLIPTTFNQILENKKWLEKELDSVFLFNENADIIDCNENMVKNLGYNDKSEILNLNMADIDALENKKALKDKIKKVKKNGSYSYKTIHKKKDGSAILVYEHLQYHKDKKAFKGIIRKD